MLRLHWTEGKAEFYTPSGRVADTIWTKISRELGSVKVDKQLLSELFETKTTELKVKVPVYSLCFSTHSDHYNVNKHDVLSLLAVARWRYYYIVLVAVCGGVTCIWLITQVACHRRSVRKVIFYRNQSKLQTDTVDTSS